MCSELAALHVRHQHRMRLLASACRCGFEVTRSVGRDELESLPCQEKVTLCAGVSETKPSQTKRDLWKRAESTATLLVGWHGELGNRWARVAASVCLSDCKHSRCSTTLRVQDGRRLLNEGIQVVSKVEYEGPIARCGQLLG